MKATSNVKLLAPFLLLCSTSDCHPPSSLCSSAAPAYCLQSLLFHLRASTSSPTWGWRKECLWGYLNTQEIFLFCKTLSLYCRPCTRLSLYFLLSVARGCLPTAAPDPEYEPVPILAAFELFKLPPFTSPMERDNNILEDIYWVLNIFW